MTWFDLTSVFTTQAAPWLPEPALAHTYLKLSWAVVLGAVAWRLGLSLPTHWRWVLVFSGVVWSVWPGEVSAAHWLGLAFQAPSVMLVTLCLAWGWQQWRKGSPLDNSASDASRLNQVMVFLGVVLGWCLLGDMLVWWQLPSLASVYALGFGSAALAVACGVVGLAWIVTTKARQITWMGGVFALVMGVYVVTRLPSGNLWDALLDPWLWMGLQVHWLTHAVRRWLRVWRGSATIHA